MKFDFKKMHVSKASVRLVEVCLVCPAVPANCRCFQWGCWENSHHPQSPRIVLFRVGHISQDLRFLPPEDGSPVSSRELITTAGGNS